MDKVEIELLKGVYNSVLHKISKQILSGNMVNIFDIKNTLEEKNFDVYLYTAVIKLNYKYNEHQNEFPHVTVSFTYKNTHHFKGGFSINIPYKSSLNAYPIAMDFYLTHKSIENKLYT